MKKTFATRDLTVCAMIASLYVALCFALSPISFGTGQIRVAEALTLLPVLAPVSIWGVTLGCALANLIGFMTGANILGFLDVFFGTAATLAAALLSYLFRNIRVKGIPLLSSLPPVIINAIVIGAELSVVGTNSLNMKVFIINAVSVGMGQLISCCVLGLLLVYLLEKTGAAAKTFGTI